VIAKETTLRELWTNQTHEIVAKGLHSLILFRTFFNSYSNYQKETYK
jgi:hypothetical protein